MATPGQSASIIDLSQKGSASKKSGKSKHLTTPKRIKCNIKFATGGPACLDFDPLQNHHLLRQRDQPGCIQNRNPEQGMQGRLIFYQSP